MGSTAVRAWDAMWHNPICGSGKSSAIACLRGPVWREDVQHVQVAVREMIPSRKSLLQSPIWQVIEAGVGLFNEPR